MIITRHEYTHPDLSDTLWPMYEHAFEEINALAVNRHLMTPTEFDHMLHNPKIMKHVAWADDTQNDIVGQAVITRHLDAWPLISPAYFQRRWPQHYTEQRIFYVGYVCTTPGAPLTTFREIIADMAEDVFKEDGIAVMDFCTRNAHIVGATTTILGRLNNNTDHEHLDSQAFHAWRFDKAAW